MIRDYSPTLLVRQKWHVQRRNVMVGDVVMMQDSNAIRGEWKLGKISKVEGDKNGVVRKCEVQYKPKVDVDNTNKKYVTLKRLVQRLIVIVPANNDI